MISQSYQQIVDSALKETLQVRSQKQGWNFIKRGKYLTLSNISYRDLDYKLAKLEGIIPVNFEKAAFFYFENNETQKGVRNNIQDIINVETVNEDCYVILVKLKPKLIVSAREVLGIQYKKRLNQNEIVIIRGNLEEHPKVPKNNKIVRCEGKVYGIFLTKIDEQTTKFEAYLVLDPKGNIPAFVVNFVTEGLLSEFEDDIGNIQKL